MLGNRIWVSGSSGYVGSYLLPFLRESGYEVFGITNNKLKSSKDLIYVDFSNRKKIKDAVLKYGVPDTFIHLGWGNVYQIQDEIHIKSNVENSINLIDVLYSEGLTRFISVGSVSEYGAKIGLLKEDEKLQEPENNYVLGKVRVSEYGLKLAEEYKKIFLHIRLFYTYGFGQSHNSLINQLFEKSNSNEDMNLSPCDQYRDYIYIEEALEGFKRLLNVNKTGIINLGSGNVTQLKDFVNIMWSELGQDSSRLIFGAHQRPSHEQSQNRAYADLTKLHFLTGWKPNLSIRQGIKKTVEKFKHAQQSLV